MAKTKVKTKAKASTKAAKRKRRRRRLNPCRHKYRTPRRMLRQRYFPLLANEERLFSSYRRHSS